tara:strand:+ start:3885 stop:4502 length:618 start_codon:yes stop_codon:yes gene_type:complete
MELNETIVKLMKEQAEKPFSGSTNKELRATAEANPHFQKLRKDVAGQSLVPKKQVKPFLRGLALLNNPKALNGLVKKTGYIKDKGERNNAVNYLSTGAQLFTKNMANVMAAYTIKAGDMLKKGMQKGMQKGMEGAPMTEQTHMHADELMATVNKAQKNAAAFLSANFIGKKDIEQVSINPDNPKITSENKLREIIRKKVQKAIKG